MSFRGDLATLLGDLIGDLFTGEAVIWEGECLYLEGEVALFFIGEVATVFLRGEDLVLEGERLRGDPDPFWGETCV